MSDCTASSEGGAGGVSSAKTSCGELSSSRLSRASKRSAMFFRELVDSTDGLASDDLELLTRFRWSLYFYY